MGHVWTKYVVFLHRKQVFEIFTEGSSAIPEGPRKCETTGRMGFFIFSLFLMCSHHIPHTFPKLPISFLRHLASHISSHIVWPSLNQHMCIYMLYSRERRAFHPSVSSSVHGWHHIIILYNVEG